MDTLGGAPLLADVQEPNLAGESLSLDSEKSSREPSKVASSKPGRSRFYGQWFQLTKKTGP